MDSLLPPELQHAIERLAIGLPVKGGTATLIHDMQAESDVLCRAVLKSIPDTSRVAWVLNPRMSLLDFMRVLCQAFRVTWQPREDMSVDALETRLKESLRQSQHAGKQCVLVIDQAQNAPFFALNRLSQLNAPDARGLRLLQIVLIGQRSLRKMLEQPELKPTTDAVVAWHELLDPEASPLPVLDEKVNLTVRVSEWPPLEETRASRFNTDEPPPAAQTDARQPARSAPTRVLAVGAAGAALAGLVAWALWPTGSAQNKSLASVPASAEVAPDNRTDQVSQTSSAAKVPEPSVAPAASESSPAGKAKKDASSTAAGAATGQAKPEAGIQSAVKPPAAPPSSDTQSARSTAAGVQAVAMPKAGVVTDRTQDPQTTGAVPKLSELSDDQDATWPLLGQLWGVKLPAKDACEVATGQRVQCFRYSGLSLEQVRLIDRPSMLLMTQNGIEKWVRLLALDNSKALLASSGRQWTVSLSELKGMWTGMYATLWRLPPNHNKRVFAATMDDEAGRWLNQQLKSLQAKGTLGTTEDALSARVKAFQRANKLRDDGRATPSTFVLVSRMVGVDEPDLRKPVR